MITKNSVLNCSCGCGFEPTKSAMWFLESLGRWYTVTFNKPLHITSGARCTEHNKAIGGVANSAHTRGLAFDVAFESSRECYEIVHHLFKMGVPRIGLNFAKNFVHFDIDETLPQHVLFKY